MLRAVMLNIIILNIANNPLIPSVIMLSVFILYVVMLSVAAPYKRLLGTHSAKFTTYTVLVKGVNSNETVEHTCELLKNAILIESQHRQ